MHDLADHRLRTRPGAARPPPELPCPTPSVAALHRRSPRPPPRCAPHRPPLHVCEPPPPRSAVVFAETALRQVIEVDRPAQAGRSAPSADDAGTGGPRHRPCRRSRAGAARRCGGCGCALAPVSTRAARRRGLRGGGVRVVHAVRARARRRRPHRTVPGPLAAGRAADRLSATGVLDAMTVYWRGRFATLAAGSGAARTAAEPTGTLRAAGTGHLHRPVLRRTRVGQRWPRRCQFPWRAALPAPLAAAWWPPLPRPACCFCAAAAAAANSARPEGAATGPTVGAGAASTLTLNKKPNDSSFIPSSMPANMSKPSRAYSTSGRCWANPRRPMPSRR